MSKEVIWAERKYINIRPSNYRSGGASGIIVLCTKVKKMFVMLLQMCVYFHAGQDEKHA